MSRVLIVDGNHALYGALFGYSGLSYNGLGTECVYGMPAMLRSAINDVRPNEIYVVWDGHKNAKGIRRTILPTYKSHRSETLVDLDDLIRQKKLVQELLNYLGVKQLLVPNLEGDDTLYYLIQKIKTKFDYITIYSGDKDFNQLLSTQIRIYRRTFKGAITVTYKNCFEHFGYHSHETVDWLTIVGDKSDDIPGVSGAGEKTARALLDKYKSLATFIKSGKTFPRVNNDSLNKVYTINRELIDLQVFYERNIRNKIKLKWLFTSTPTGDIKKFNKLSTSLGITKFLDLNFFNNFKQQ